MDQLPWMDSSNSIIADSLTFFGLGYDSPVSNSVTVDSLAVSGLWYDSISSGIPERGSRASDRFLTLRLMILYKQAPATQAAIGKPMPMPAIVPLLRLPSVETGDPDGTMLVEAGEAVETFDGRYEVENWDNEVGELIVDVGWTMIEFDVWPSAAEICDGERRLVAASALSVN